MRVGITIQQCFSRSATLQKAPATLVVPSVAPKKGSSRHLPRYDVDKEPILVNLTAHLTSFNGGSKSATEARQVASDVLKYLPFASDRHAKWESLLDLDKIKTYLTALENNEIGKDSLTTKCDRLLCALRYMFKQELVPHDRYTKIKDTLSDWKQSFAKHKVSLQIARGVKEGNQGDPGNLQVVNTALNDAALQDRLVAVAEMPVASLTNQDVSTLVTYLFCKLMYGNWQSTQWMS